MLVSAAAKLAAAEDAADVASPPFAEDITVSAIMETPQMNKATDRECCRALRIQVAGVKPLQNVCTTWPKPVDLEWHPTGVPGFSVEGMPAKACLSLANGASADKYSALKLAQP